MPNQHYRALFISDVNLGTADCKAEYLLAFLQQVFAPFMQMAATGTEVIYIPGNHDAAMRRFCDQALAGIRIERQATFRTLGRRYLKLPYWSFARYVKIRLANAAEFIRLRYSVLQSWRLGVALHRVGGNPCRQLKLIHSSGHHACLMRERGLHWPVPIAVANPGTSKPGTSLLPASAIEVS